MIIPVCGMDPSFTHWGIAEGMLDLESGVLSTPLLQTIVTAKTKQKQLRVNSDDMQRCEDLAEITLQVARRNKVVFIECPVGSQNAAAMKSYGACVMLFGVLRAEGIPVIEITAAESKKIFTGDKNATKQMMIDKAVELYPDANFPRYQRQVAKGAEHVADAIAAIHAGVRTPLFQNLMRLFAEV